MWYIILVGVIVCIAMALKTLFFPSKFRYKQVSLENFLFLGCTYAIIMIGFGLIFGLLEMKGIPVLLDARNSLDASWYQRLGSAFYLSGITLFSVGYGDVVPIGIGRILAIIEALLGYTIPAAFVVRTFIDYNATVQTKKREY